MSMTLQELSTVMVEQNKSAFKTSATRRSGKIFNDRVINLIKPRLPMMVKGYADTDLGRFVIANAVAAAIVPDSKVVIKDVTLNPTRIEAYRALERMGADIRYITKEDLYEPIGDIEIRYSGELQAITVEKNIAWLIDELPALSIAMARANGTSHIKNAKELRVKESDRISTVVDGLKACGIESVEVDDGYSIVGGSIHSATIDSHGDHRIAMSFAIAGIVDGMEIVDIDCIDTSFPNFFDILSQITKVKI